MEQRADALGIGFSEMMRRILDGVISEGGYHTSISTDDGGAWHFANASIWHTDAEGSVTLYIAPSEGKDANSD